MTIRMSSACAQALVGQYGLTQLMQGGHIRIYSGAQPASADAAPTGVLLATVTRNGNPVPDASDWSGGLYLQPSLRWGEAVDSADWQATVLEDGVPGWWRWLAFEHSADDAGTASVRIDGAVGESLDLGGVTAFTAGQTLPVMRFSVRFTPN